jgi:hypothetical protein
MKSLKRLLNVVNPDEGLTLVSYCHSLRFNDDRLRGLKISKITKTDPAIARALMSSLLAESYDSFNFGTPLSTKYLANVVDYVLTNYGVETLNDFAGYCYKLSVGDLFEGKVYRIGQAELIDAWKRFIDQKWERVERNYEKQKEKHLSTPVESISNTFEKADPDVVAALLDRWRRGKVKESLEAQSKISSDSSNKMDENAYLKQTIYALPTMSDGDIANLLIYYGQEIQTYRYSGVIARALNSKRIASIRKLFENRISDSVIHPIAAEAISKHFIDTHGVTNK